MKTSDKRVLRDAAELLNDNAAVIERSHKSPDGVWETSDLRREFNEHVRLATRLRQIAEAS
jgi:hypothetical protein